MSFFDYVALLLLLAMCTGFAWYMRIGGREAMRTQLDMLREREKAIKGQYDKPKCDAEDDERSSERRAAQDLSGE